MIAVLDTNVLISATLREGSVPWQALHVVLRQGTLSPHLSRLLIRLTRGQVC